MNKYFVIYRDKESKKINRYSSYNKNENLSDMIDKYNSDNTRNHTLEIVIDHDLISALEIAENNKKLKDYDLRNIEQSIDSLSNEFYLLKESLKRPN